MPASRRRKESKPRDRATANWKGQITKANKAADVAAEQVLQLLEENLANRDWRLRNLYHIVDKKGRRVLFQPNDAQKRVYEQLANRSVILKIRQPGVTTGLCILWLDSILFNEENLKVGIVADTLDNAKTILKDKVLYPYDNLPEEIKARFPWAVRNTQEFELAKGSRITVDTSFRSGTIQILHVTEYGEICAKHPLHAQEVRSGAMEAVPQDGIVVYESTAKGREGHFYELVQDAQKGDPALSEWRFTFLAWWEIAEYTKDGPTLEFPPDKEYLDKLETEIGRKLTPGQRRWWCWKRHDQGEDMHAQYPGTPEEAFKQSTEGAYYGRQMMDAWQQRRITTLLIDPSILVETWWDIGMADSNVIWFVQRLGNEIRLVDYYENSGEVLGHYATYIREWKERNRIVGFSRHIAPHDIANREWTGAVSGERRVDAALKAGIEFVAAPKLPVHDGIDAVRRALPLCRFDAERCKRGIDCLEHYRKEWNEMLGVYRNQPLHDWASHGADAFRTGITMGDAGLPGVIAQTRAAVVPPPRRKVVW